MSIAPDAYYRAFDYTHRVAIRVCSLVAASISIPAGLLAFYFMAMIHPKKRTFRHNLILILLIFDFIKAIALLVFPAVSQRTHERISTDARFQDALGWLTCFGIEGADFIILCFAVHIALLIFFPNLRYRLRGVSCRLISADTQEGGLYPFRAYVYILSVVFPAIVSSTGYAPHQGYRSSVTWSYLTNKRAVWYFAWILRYLIVIVILAIYVGVYIHVLRQYKVVSRRMDTAGAGAGSAGGARAGGPDARASPEDSPRGIISTIFSDSVWYKLGKALMMLLFPDVQISQKLHGRALNTRVDRENIKALHYEQPVQFNQNPFATNAGAATNSAAGASADGARAYPNSNALARTQTLAPNELPGGVSAATVGAQINVGLDIQRMLHREAMDRFQARRAQIMRQMNVIFVYPLSYLFLWFFPFIQQCYTLRKGGNTWGTFWAYALASFFQAFNCTIDALVFFFREKPWQLRCDQVDPTMRYHYSYWRRALSFLPGYHLTQGRAGDASAGCAGGAGSSSARAGGSGSTGSACAGSGSTRAGAGSTSAGGTSSTTFPSKPDAVPSSSTSSPSSYSTCAEDLRPQKKMADSAPAESAAATAPWMNAVDFSDEDVSDFVRIDGNEPHSQQARKQSASVDPNDSCMSLRDFLGSAQAEQASEEIPQAYQAPDDAAPDPAALARRHSSRFSWRTFSVRGSMARSRE